MYWGKVGDNIKIKTNKIMAKDIEKKLEPELGKKQEETETEKSDHEAEQRGIAQEYLREQDYYGLLNDASLHLEGMQKRALEGGDSSNASRFEQDFKQISKLMGNSGKRSESLLNKLSEEAKEKYLRGGEEMDTARKEADAAYE